MENYLMISGKKIELTEEQIKILSGEEEKKDIWKPQCGEKYYWIDSCGQVRFNFWINYESDKTKEKVGNCCADEALMQKRALVETLNRLLWQFTLQNGWSDNLWKNITIGKFYIFSNTERIYGVSFNFDAKSQGTVYFISKEVAQRAIDEIIKPFIEEHPELMEEFNSK